MLPVLLHIPHASTLVPEEYLSDYVISPDEIARENLRLADLYTDEIYNLPGAARAVFPVSRFLVDAERFSDDAQEPMAKRGMGALYTVTTDLEPMRLVTPKLRTELMDRYYWPHHNALDKWAAEMLDKAGECLVIDCHSYPSKALSYELDNQTMPRPQIGVGTDSFHTPPGMADFVIQAFRDRGYETEQDIPFSGALVPNMAYGKDKRVKSFMIEIRKDLYMDEETGTKTANFRQLKQDIEDILQETAWNTLLPGNRAVIA